MSHIHNIGNSSATAEYQDYLARLAAARELRQKENAGGKAVTRTFDSAIDTERDPDAEEGESDQGEKQGESGENLSSEPAQQEDPRGGWSVKV